MNEQWADLHSHHIEGFASMGEGFPRFHVPLISHVTGNLWTGGCRHGVRLPDEFRYVISLYPHEKYDLGPDTIRHEINMYDSPEIPDEKVLQTLATLANRYLDRGQTLVHCQAGLNRSALVAGLALVQSGMPARRAIDLLRVKRSPVVLCNEVFADWLLSLDGTGNERWEKI